MAYIMHYTELISKLAHYASLPNYYDNKTTAWLTWNKSKGAWPADCIRGPKGIIYWGWNEDKTKAHGGAVYNKKTDYTEAQWINHCNNVSTDFNWMKVGELLYMPGHCGIYMGDWTVFEITTGWNKNGAVLSHIDNTGRRTLNNVAPVNAYWKKHGEIPEIDYTPLPLELKVAAGDKMNYMQSWFINNAPKDIVLYNGIGYFPNLIMRVQEYLQYYGWYSGDIDGDFGPFTEAAVRGWQAHSGREATGKIQYEDWCHILTR